MKNSSIEILRVKKVKNFWNRKFRVRHVRYHISTPGTRRTRLKNLKWGIYRSLCYNKIKYAAKYDDLARFREAIRINIFSKSKTVLFENFKEKPTKTVENAKTEYFFEILQH